jgi:hypothetical protein
MKMAAALPPASTACLRQPPDPNTARKSRLVRGDLVRGDPRGEPIWCVHCYQLLASAGSRRSHRCPQKLLAKLPASPPPYN